jgi:hypothetical protein
MLTEIKHRNSQWGRVIPRRGIIGTTQGKGVLIIGDVKEGYGRVSGYQPTLASVANVGFSLRNRRSHIRQKFSLSGHTDRRSECDV